jgi:hypothetical protein
MKPVTGMFWVFQRMQVQDLKEFIAPKLKYSGNSGTVFDITVQNCYILVSVISSQLYEWFGGSRDHRGRVRTKR